MEETVDNIVPIEPKRSVETYRRHKIVVTFIPDKKEWKWSFKHTQTNSFSNTANTYAMAFLDARRLIDQLEAAS